MGTATGWDRFGFWYRGGLGPDSRRRNHSSGSVGDVVRLTDRFGFLFRGGLGPGFRQPNRTYSRVEDAVRETENLWWSNRTNRSGGDAARAPGL
jgi:hypothetical protein